MSEQKSSAIRFVDRRRFDDEGDLRADAPPEPPPAAPPVAAAPSPAPAAPAAGSGAPGADDVPADEPGGPVRFEHLLQSLVAPLQMLLSGQAGPVGRDEMLAQVNFTIEAVELLERKTRGNLTEREAQGLKSAGGQLKMIYMQLMNAPAGKA